MSLFHMYSDNDELFAKGNELVDRLEDLSRELMSKTRNYSFTMKKIHVIEDYLDKHFWHEEHIQARHYYKNINNHISDHMGILSAFKNFITILEFNGITSEQAEYFEKKIMIPFKEHFNKQDKVFIDYLNNTHKYSRKK